MNKETIKTIQEKIEIAMNIAEGKPFLIDMYFEENELQNIMMRVVPDNEKEILYLKLT